MLLRSASTGGFEVYDIANNNITGAAFLGTVGMDWQVMGFGNFSSRGETDMIMRNVNNGGVEVYNISNNQITGAAFMGTVGLNWQFSGVGNFSGRGESDMLLRNSNTGGGGLRHRQQPDHRRRLHWNDRIGLAVLGRREFQQRPRRDRPALAQQQHRWVGSVQHQQQSTHQRGWIGSSRASPRFTPPVRPISCCATSTAARSRSMTSPTIN